MPWCMIGPFQKDGVAPPAWARRVAAAVKTVSDGESAKIKVAQGSVIIA